MKTTEVFRQLDASFCNCTMPVDFVEFKIARTNWLRKVGNVCAHNYVDLYVCIRVLRATYNIPVHLNA